MHPLPFRLDSLYDMPSWCNRAGRADRCACQVIDVGKLWRHIPSNDWHMLNASPLPGPGAGARRRSTTVQPLVETHFQLHRHQIPALRLTRHLRGHDRIHRCHIVRFQHLSLQLPADWTQNLRLQRWRLHQRLSQHFFICPWCERKSKHLYMPRCTNGEYADARILAEYLRREHPAIDLDNPQHPKLPGALVAVIARYALVFQPRRFLCRACLGLRYGDVKNASQFYRGHVERNPPLDNADARRLLHLTLLHLRASLTIPRRPPPIPARFRSPT
ncbi:MAG: hypothetical protein IT445_08375 [Phycisphaeraceae bacterium]|nr:hypothetical protein [Phycisphaeraceae bacterium]